MFIYQAGEREYKGNLHMHTTASDGNKSPMEAALLYEAAGYDFIAFTDHRGIAKLPEYRGKMLLLPGIEMDVEPGVREVTHLLGIGVGDSLMEGFRPGLSGQDYIDLAVRSGGLCFLAHPAWSMMRLDTIKALRGLSGIEIYNSVSCPPYNPDRADATHMLDLLAADGLLYPAIAADDSHYYCAECMKGYIWLQAESLTRESVLKALAQERYYASQGPRFLSVSMEGGLVRVSCSPVSHILFHSDIAWSEGRAVSGDGLTRASYRPDLARGESFIRVILIDSVGRRAWMKPFKVQPEEGH